MNESIDSDIAVFCEAVRLSVAERGAFLDRACVGDAALRGRVEALLRAHENAGDFLVAPLDGVPKSTGSPAGGRAGDRVGRYKLLEQIGEGGCGVVFKADQEEPVRRQVALKLVKPGMDTKWQWSGRGAGNDPGSRQPSARPPKVCPTPQGAGCWS